MKKHRNPAKTCEATTKSGNSAVPVRREAREVTADLVVQLTQQLEGKSVPLAEGAGDGGDALRPNSDRLTVGVDLGDQWSNDCILGLGRETEGVLISV